MIDSANNFKTPSFHKLITISVKNMSMILRDCGYDISLFAG